IAGRAYRPAREPVIRFRSGLWLANCDLVEVVLIPLERVTEQKRAAEPTPEVGPLLDASHPLRLADAALEPRNRDERRDDDDPADDQRREARTRVVVDTAARPGLHLLVRPVEPVQAVERDEGAQQPLDNRVTRLDRSLCVGLLGDRTAWRRRRRRRRGCRGRGAGLPARRRRASGIGRPARAGSRRSCGRGCSLRRLALGRLLRRAPADRREIASHVLLLVVVIARDSTPRSGGTPARAGAQNSVSIQSIIERSSRPSRSIWWFFC